MNQERYQTRPVTKKLSSFEFEVAPTARADLVEIPAMRRDIQLQRIITRIPQQVDRSLIPRDIRQRRRHAVGRTDVVLRTDMHEPQRHGGQPRYRILLVRHAIDVAQALVRDETRRRRPADPGSSIGIQVRWRAALFYLRRGEIGDRAAETVAHDHDFRSRVRGGGGFEGGEDAGARFEPGGPEAEGDFAACAEVGGDGGEFDVGDEVADGFGAAEGEDGEVVGFVDCDVACYVCGEGAVVEVMLVIVI